MAKEQVSSIMRALQILECFMDQNSEWTLKAMVAHLELPTTTVYRQVSTLVDRQYLIQDPVRKSYRIGPRLMQLASAIFSQSDLRKLSRPSLERLSDQVGETINLSMLLEHDIFYLDKVETHRTIVCNTRVGARVPAYATSAGKIILAYQDEAQIDRYCEWMEQAAEPLTDHTILSGGQLRQQLAQARLLGYAIDDGEIEQGLICIGAPIFDMFGKVSAAVSVSGPDYRMLENRDTILRSLKEASTQISRLSGYRI